MARVFVAVGSNLGNREKTLRQGQLKLSQVQGIRFVRASSVFETDPVGGESHDKYLNAVWEIETELSPRSLLEKLLSVEQNFGRKRTVRNAPRTLDLDILFYDQRIIEEPGLSIPHPRLQERTFVLEPLQELAPEWKHPKLKKTVQELWEAIVETHPKP